MTVAIIGQSLNEFFENGIVKAFNNEGAPSPDVEANLAKMDLPVETAMEPSLSRDFHLANEGLELGQNNMLRIIGGTSIDMVPQPEAPTFGATMSPGHAP